MGQVLHLTATTTHRARKELQASEQPIQKTDSTYNICCATPSKWRNRELVEDVASGRKKGDGSILNVTSLSKIGGLVNITFIGGIVIEELEWHKVSQACWYSVTSYAIVNCLL